VGEGGCTHVGDVRSKCSGSLVDYRTDQGAAPGRCSRIRGSIFIGEAEKPN